MSASARTPPSLPIPVRSEDLACGLAMKAERAPQNLPMSLLSLTTEREQVLVLDRLDTLPIQFGQVIAHGLELFGCVADPVGDFAEYA